MEINPALQSEQEEPRTEAHSRDLRYRHRAFYLRHADDIAGSDQPSLSVVPRGRWPPDLHMAASRLWMAPAHPAPNLRVHRTPLGTARYSAAGMPVSLS
jgi:hypothetical protein